MRIASLSIFFQVAVLCVLWTGRAGAAEPRPPEVSQPNTNEVSAANAQRSALQLQEAIQTVQLAVERAQQDAQAAAQRNAEEIASRFQLLEKSLTARRAKEQQEALASARRDAEDTAARFQLLEKSLTAQRAKEEQDFQAAAQRTAEDLAARLQLLEKTLTAQRAKEQQDSQTAAQRNAEDLAARFELLATSLTAQRAKEQQDAQAAAQRSAEDTAARFQLLEKTLTAQRAKELEVVQRANHVTLVLAGTAVALVFIAMLFTAYFQWRVVDRLTELSSLRPALRAPGTSRARPEITPGSGQTPSTQAVEEANARLLYVVEQLQQRILEFEQVARAPMKEKIKPAAAGVGKA